MQISSVIRDKGYSNLAVLSELSVETRLSLGTMLNQRRELSLDTRLSLGTVLSLDTRLSRV